MISPKTSKIDPKRYRKVRWFFIKIFLHTIWWDIILNRPVLRFFRTPAIPRWQEIAKRFRSLAVEMGGVLIKLGQFLSIRVDILPTEVTSELAGLQDEVPPEKIGDIISQIEEDFDRPISLIFKQISPVPLGAASLAQAHLVRLFTGEEAVVKVLRPGIDVLVETDLAAIRLAFRWLRHYKRISLRVDLDWLSEEFTTVTRNELNLESEGRNAERLAADFTDYPGVYLPKVYWEYCAPRTLTLENVGYIKIGDLEAIEAAGISRPRVADELYKIYMRQVFETHFLHVDPHPGNLFIKPLPHPQEIETGVTGFAPGDPVPYIENRPFQIVFVDFGMAVTIPERLRASLKEYAIGVGTQDAHKIVQALVSAGTLMPGADLKRLEEAHEVLFRRLWGVRSGQFRDLAVKEARYFLKEYRDVIYDAPFQFQADMLFVVRAVGILSGMAANLDPDFDPWAKTIPFAERYAREELQRGWRELFREAMLLGRTLIRLPNQLDEVLSKARREDLTIRTSFSPEAGKIFVRLEKAVKGLGWMMLCCALLISGAILRTSGQDAFLSWSLLVLGFLAFLKSIRRD